MVKPFLTRTVEEHGFVIHRLADQEETDPPNVDCLMRGGNGLSYAMVEEGLALPLPDANRALHTAEANARETRRDIGKEHLGRLGNGVAPVPALKQSPRRRPFA
jgi:hypothetical protein